MARVREKPQRRPKGSGLVLSGVPRVNLLPPAELQRRAVAALTKRWVAGLAATVLMVSVLVGAAHYLRGVAAAELAAEQSRTLTLNAELAGFAHVSRAIAEQTAFTALRNSAMGNDVEWRSLFKDLIRTVPKGAQLRGFDVLPGANPAADPQSPAIGVLGALTIVSEDAGDQVRTIHALRELDSVLSADAGPVTSDPEAGFGMVVTIVMDQSYYSGAYVTPGGTR